MLVGVLTGEPMIPFHIYEHWCSIRLHGKPFTEFCIMPDMYPQMIEKMIIDYGLAAGGVSVDGGN